MVDAPDSGRFDLRGRTMKWIKSEDGKRGWQAVPIGNVEIELYRVTGPIGKPKKIAESKSDADGYYSFKNLDAFTLGRSTRPRCLWLGASLRWNAALGLLVLR